MEFEAGTEQEAVQKACSALGLGEEDLDYTVIDEGSEGVLGFGSRPVHISARVPEGVIVASVDANAGLENRGAGSDDDSAEERDGGLVGPAPEKAARAMEVAEGLAAKMGMPAMISVRDEEERIVVVIAEAEGSTSVLDTLGGSRPPAIPSFQFLLNKIVNRFPKGRKHILVEVPSVPRSSEVRAPRRGSGEQVPRAQRSAPPEQDLDPVLVELGRLLGGRALELGKVITVHPMMPAERRALHLTIMGLQGVRTVSEGEGLHRRMHIVPDSFQGALASGRRKRRRRKRRRGPDGEGAVDEQGGSRGDPGI